jgi:hypothetical protein
MTLNDTKWPFKLRRRQFLLSVCFAITIKKSQGQSLKNVGLYLLKQVFCLGLRTGMVWKCSHVKMKVQTVTWQNILFIKRFSKSKAYILTSIYKYLTSLMIMLYVLNMICIIHGIVGHQIMRRCIGCFFNKRDFLNQRYIFWFQYISIFDFTNDNVICFKSDMYYTWYCRSSNYEGYILKIHKFYHGKMFGCFFNEVLSFVKHKL